MTVLDEILEASTDSSVPVADLLRKVQIAATRLGATEIASWARQELGGYEADVQLPPYRQLSTNVMGQFSGPMRSFMTHPLSAVPDGMAALWSVELRQPLAEIQGFVENGANEEPVREWTSHDVQRYDESGLFRMEYHSLFRAWNVLPRQVLLGIVDTIRTRAMEFALDLQMAFPDAGSAGGPTVETTPALARTIYNITNNITGNGANVAAGETIAQSSSVVVGDVSVFLSRLAELGMEEAEAHEYVAALQEDGTVEGPRTSRFLDRVRSGAVQLGAGLATDVAAEVLVSLGRGFLGI